MEMIKIEFKKQEIEQLLEYLILADWMKNEASRESKELKQKILHAGHEAGLHSLVGKDKDEYYMTVMLEDRLFKIIDEYDRDAIMGMEHTTHMHSQCVYK